MNYIPSWQSFLSVLFVCIASPSISKTLYVSPSGDDSVLYDANAIDMPWRTLNRAMYNLKAGDTLYVRAGVYSPSTEMYFASDYRSQENGNPEAMNAETGTASARVRITSYPDEQDEVIIDLKNVAFFADFDNKSYWTFDRLNFVNARMIFFVGQDFPTEHNHFRGLKVESNRGGDNIGSFMLQNANHTIIEHCVLLGPGNDSGIHLNTNNIFATRLNHLVIRNNIMGSSPIGVYLKHANAPENTSALDSELIIENNFFFDHTRRSFETNGNTLWFKNNILGPNSAGVRNNEANGAPGGDYNRYEHNTFSSGAFDLSGDTQSGDTLPGSNSNTLIGNIFNQYITIHEYSSDTPTGNALDKNLFPSSELLRHNRTNFSSGSLPSWVTESGSVIGEPMYTGSNMYRIESYVLKSSSPGKNINGTSDAGAVTSLVGPSSDYVNFSLDDRDDRYEENRAPRPPVIQSVSY